MRRLTLPLYLGGFLGPFGGGMLAALIPSVADGLDTSVTLVAAAITSYMVPFAALQLVSGTLAERLGPRRVVRTGYVLYGAATVACAFAPEIWSFIAARAVMGAANAFLLAVPRRSLGGLEHSPGGGATLRSLLNRWISSSPPRRCSGTSASPRSASCSSLSRRRSSGSDPERGACSSPATASGEYSSAATRAPSSTASAGRRRRSPARLRASAASSASTSPAASGPWRSSTSASGARRPSCGPA